VEQRAAQSVRCRAVLSYKKENNMTGSFTAVQEVEGLLQATNVQPSWPDAGLLLPEVVRRLAGLSGAEAVGPTLTLGAWNLEFLNRRKAEYFLDVYKEVVQRHHLIAVEEVDDEGLIVLAEACGYNRLIASPNSRGQAVGFLVHKRLHVLACREYKEIIGVMGVPDLRSALRLVLYDEITNQRFSAIVVHLKSMRGGIRSSSVIRFTQLKNLMECLDEPEQLELIMGDFNCFLDHAWETRPLLANGYSLLNRWDRTATHHFGGRLDGLFYANLPASYRLGSYNIRNFWRSNLIGCSLSDHGLLSWKLAPYADVQRP
jgi:endonuclease/exonuclease/phosphatase family metal-dependent hydrolase